MLQLTKLPWLRKHHTDELSSIELQTYKLEKIINFRWIARHFGKHSDVALSSKDIVSPTLQEELSKIGQFTEVAYGMFDPNLVWRYLEDLSKPGYPFDHHDALRDAMLLDVLHGRLSHVQAIIAYRKQEQQLIVAFSGTFNVMQALHDINAFHSKYSPCRKSGFGAVKTHAGFWKLYLGVRRIALETLRDRVHSNSDVKEIVVTGHSLGGALALLFMMDLLSPDFCSEYMKGAEIVRPACKCSLVIYGTPRVGNKAFAELYQSSVARFREERGDTSYRDFSVKAYNDGVPALPSQTLGYRHAVNTVLYLHHGCLYRTPLSESECSIFNVSHDEQGYTSSPPPFPRGGHNYYNGRDLEKIARRMEWISDRKGKELDKDWQERFMTEVEREGKRLEKMLRKSRRAIQGKGNFDRKSPAEPEKSSLHDPTNTSLACTKS